MTSDLLWLAEADPARCVEEGKKRLDGGAETAAGAHRALGVAYRTLGRVADSITHLEAAVDAYNALGDENLVHESLISLAPSIAMSGDMAGALATLDRVAQGPASEIVGAQEMVQRAGLIARTGDLLGAIDLYAKAHPVLDAARDERWLSLLYSNRGLVHTFLSDFESADHDLVKARDLYVSMDQLSSAAEMTHNRAFAAIQAGRIADGLQLLEEAQEGLTELGMPVQEIVADRAIAYMLAGLPEPALELAEASIGLFESKGQELERAEAMFSAAEIALAMGEWERAGRLAADARSVLAAQDRTLWSQLCDLIIAESAIELGQRRSSAELAATADSLADGGHHSAAYRARLVATRAALDSDPADALRLSTDPAAASPTGLPVPARIRAAHLEARAHLAQADQPAALVSLRRAARLLSEYREAIAGTEAQVAIGRFAKEIAGLGLDLIHERSRPGAAVAWLEKFRHASSRLIDVTGPSDAEMGAALAELRELHRETDQESDDGDGMAGLVRDVQRVERRIRRRSLSTRKETRADGRGSTLSEVRRSLNGRTMVYFYVASGHLTAVRIRSDSTRRLDLGPIDDARVAAAHLMSDLRRHLSGPTDRTIQRLSASLAAASDRFLGQSLRSESAAVVVPPPEFFALPWPALFGSGEVTVVPSAGRWLAAASILRGTGPVVTVAGPGLEWAESEATAVAGVHRGPVEALTGSAASVDAVSAVLKDASIAHFACHADLRRDNAMFSALRLADGQLSLYDLERVSPLPQVVVLSACNSAHSGPVSGEEFVGLSSVLLRGGARTVIATSAPVPDSSETVDVMTELHRGLADSDRATAAIQRVMGGGAPGVQSALVTMGAH